MFRAINLPILSSTRLCVTASDIMHPRFCQPVAWKRRKFCASRQPAGIIPVHYTTSRNTQSTALEDGQNDCPKHVELIGTINKSLLLHLVGCLRYLQAETSFNYQAQRSRTDCPSLQGQKLRSCPQIAVLRLPFSLR